MTNILLAKAPKLLKLLNLSNKFHMKWLFMLDVCLYPLQTVFVCVCWGGGGGEGRGGYTVFTLSVCMSIHLLHLVSECEVSNEHCLLTFLILHNLGILPFYWSHSQVHRCVPDFDPIFHGTHA